MVQNLAIMLFGNAVGFALLWTKICTLRLNYARYLCPIFKLSFHVHCSFLSSPMNKATRNLEMKQDMLLKVGIWHFFIDAAFFENK